MNDPAHPDFDEHFRDGFETLLRWRRDVRQFLTDPLPDDLVEHLLDLACLAPSVGNSQPWRFVMVDRPETRAAVRAEVLRANADAAGAQDDQRRAAYQALKLEGLDRAPVQIAVFAVDDPDQGHGLGRRTMPETVAYSAVLAIHTLWLAARAYDIGVGWVSILDPAPVVALLDVPDDWRFIGYLCIGRPAELHEVPELERRGWQDRQSDCRQVLRR
ncbi:5,6-dimethylbenzimidazole synthase [Tistrella bauzanensis]|uniref:5,6-dimethylbenzimidazole synthase n=1 Tax=Tistrella arctica TaxID=3133430 RepID=A0ABU9YPE0_9PROT